MTTYFGGESPGVALASEQEENRMTIIKTYTVSVEYSRNDREDVCDTCLAYLQLRELIAKLISQSVHISMGEMNARISGIVVET